MRLKTFQKNHLQYALEVGTTVADYFVDYFQVDYPLPKLDMAAIPDYSSGATEHWGLITYRETNLVFNCINKNKPIFLSFVYLSLCVRNGIKDAVFYFRCFPSVFYFINFSRFLAKPRVRVPTRSALPRWSLTSLLTSGSETSWPSNGGRTCGQLFHLCVP